MSNTVHLRGTITHITVHPTSLFMVVREDRANGVPFHVKAFCPPEMKQNSQDWAQNYLHWGPGMRLVIEGSLRAEPEKAWNPQSSTYENTRHPVTGKDIFQTYIWAYYMDVVAVFEPAQQHQAPRPIQAAPNRAPIARAPNGAGNHQSPPPGNPAYRDKSNNHAQAQDQQLEQGPPVIPWNMEG